MDSQTSDPISHINAKTSSVVDTTNSNEVTKNSQSNEIIDECCLVNQGNTDDCLPDHATETPLIASCDIKKLPNVTSEVNNCSGYTDCDKIDKVSPIVNETLNVIEHSLQPVKVSDNTEKCDEILSTLTSENSHCLPVDSVDSSEEKCASPIVKKSKMNLQSSTSIQEVVDKVNKLDLLEQNRKSNVSTVILKSETSSLRNLLMYHSESSDNEDEDFEANWQLHVFPSTSCSSDGETDSQECVDVSDDENSEFILPNNKNSQKKKKEDDVEPTEPPPDLSHIKIDYGTEQFLHIGHITNFINTTVTIDSLQHMDSYNLETVLFIDNKTSKMPLGAISDVIGPVHQPVYCVQLRDAKDIETLGLKEGMKVYSAPKSLYTKYVFLKDLLKMRGTDASWVGDEEPPTDLDTSEDELDTEEQTSRKRAHNNSLERHRQFEHAKNRSNIIKSQVANMFDKYRPKPRAPMIHMFPVGFDPRVPPPNMQNSFVPPPALQRNIGFAPMPPRQPTVLQCPNRPPHPIQNRMFPDSRQFRGHYFTNNVGYHHNAAGPSHQNYY